MNRSLMVFMISLIFYTTNASAQSVPDRGRLENGKAYRIDNQGMRLTDYIAEMEVSNSELKNKVATLEDEIADTNRKLNALKSGSKTSVIECKETTKVIPAADCTAYQNKIADLNSQLTSLNQQLTESSRPTTITNCNYESNLNPYYRKTTELRAELESRPSMDELTKELENKEKIKDLSKEQSVKLQEISAKLSEAQTRSKSESENYTLLKEKYENSQAQIAKLQEELNSKSQEIANLSIKTSRAALINNSNVTTNAQDLKTISGLKSELRSQLQKIQTQINKRKSLLDTLKNKRTGLALSLQPLRAKDGVSLDEIRLATDKLDDEDQAIELKTKIGQIAKILDDDIQTLERLVK